MRNILKTILKILARLTLMRYKPKIIGITGSVGKTSAKDAIALVLSSKFKTRSSWENYNNEIGLPLTILGESSGDKNPLLWLTVIVRSLFKLIFGSYPEILVLEMGVDRPGDIEYLTGIVKRLDVAVITDIGVSHLEYFSSPSALAKEKFSVLKGLKKDGLAVVNFDSRPVKEGLTTKAKILSYGFEPGASVLATDFQLLKKDGSMGVNFKVHYAGAYVPFFLPNALGKPAAYACLAAAGVGIAFDLNLVDVSAGLRSFVPPPARLRLLPGVKQTLIIDDTYNAAPASTIAALETLKAVGGSRLIAVLADMAELGSFQEEGHRAVAVKISELGLSAVFLVGEKIKIIQEELVKRKFSGKIYVYKTSEEAGLPVQNFLLPHDAVLVKGSQAFRMERVVEEIMAEPLLASKLLVRQSEKWLKKAA